MAPLVPADTMAALATTIPAGELRVETEGAVKPVGHAVRYPNGAPCGIAVMFNEYACAVSGTPHVC